MGSSQALGLPEVSGKIVFFEIFYESSFSSEKSK